MTRPFTYYLYHKPTGLKYYGVRYATGCEPSDLWNKYFSSSKKVKQLIKEHGIDSFNYEIRKVFETKQQARDWETKVLQKLNVIHRTDWINESQGKANLNCATYGMLGKNHTEKSKLKIANSQLDEKNHMYGKTHTPETKEKIRVASKIRGFTPEAKEAGRLSRIGNTDWRGKKHKPESIQKIKEARARQTFSEEAKKKMSLSHLGKPLDEERKRKMSESQKRRWAKRKINLIENGRF